MENKNPDVQFILEALVGNPTAFTAQGDILLEDPSFEPLKISTWTVENTIDSLLSKIHQAKSYALSDSMLRMGTHYQSKSTTCFVL